MKNVRFLWVFIFAFGAIGTFAQKQNVEKSPEQHIEKRLEHLVKELNLSPDQLSQVRNLELETLEKRKQHRAAMEIQHEAEFAKIKAQLASVLSGEQLQLFEELHEERKQKQEFKKDKKHQRKRAKSDEANMKKAHKDRFEKLSTALSLTEEQKPLVKDILKNAKEGNKEKKHAMKAQRDQEKKAKMEAMKQILTAEQFEKFESLKDEHKGKRKRKRNK